MLTKHNVYSAKVILFSDSTKGFLYYFTSEYVFSSFRGFQDRFSRENLDHSPTIIYMYYIVGGNPALPSGFPSRTNFQYSTLSLLLYATTMLLWNSASRTETIPGSDLYSVWRLSRCCFSRYSIKDRAT